MSMTVTVLGCGSSSGVPVVGCTCSVCVSTDPKNKRTRVSVLIDDGSTRVLIDTSPDLRQQCLINNVTSVDAIIFTHDHADHTHGIDDIRPLNYRNGKPMDIYADQTTMDVLKRRFDYAFKPPIPEYGWFRPAVNSHVIEAGKPFKINTLTIQPFTQVHGKTVSMGIRAGDFAYSTDVNLLDESAFNTLSGVKVWVVDCLKYSPAPTHAHLEQTLAWIARVKPSKAVLTHMSHELDYETLKSQLPECVEPAYDGMKITL